MRFTYDPEAGAGYLYLREFAPDGPRPTTVPIGLNMHVDLVDGVIVGIEFLDPELIPEALRVEGSTEFEPRGGANWVGLDDASAGAVRVVGPFPSVEAADAWVEALDRLLETRPFLRKRMDANVATAESPGDVLEEVGREREN